MARRPNEIVHLKLRFPEFLRARVANAAKANNRSMNAEIMYRLLRAYADEDLGPGPAAERFTRAMAGVAADLEAFASRIGTTKPEPEDSGEQK
jgi:hypothetical protein